MTKIPIDREQRSRRRTKGSTGVRDKEATRAAILSAAEIEFARYGLPGAHIAAIAASAGVTKALVFHYFQSKDRLFEAVMLKASEPLRAVIHEIESSTDSPAEQQLSMLLERFLHELMTRPFPHLIFTLDSIQNNGEHFRKLNMPSLYTAIERVLEKGIQQGHFCKLDTAHAAINIVSLCMHYFHAAKLHPDPELRMNPYDPSRLERHAKEVLRFVTASTSPSKLDE